MAFSAIGGAIAGAERAEAAVVYSGIVNLNVPATVDGLYLNVVTGAASSNPQLAPGWDINPYQSSSVGPAMNFFITSSATSGNAPASSRGYKAATISGPAMALPHGTPIGPADVYNTSIASGINFTSPGTHVLGFRFQNEANANQVHYGWARLRRPGDGGIATIMDYAYESNAGSAIAVPLFTPPEPGALSLLALGAPGLLMRRRLRAGLSFSSASVAR